MDKDEDWAWGRDSFPQPAHQMQGGSDACALKTSFLQGLVETG